MQSARVVPILLYELDGLAFFTMGLAVAVEARHAGDPRLKTSFRYLALFGLLHSLVEWSGMACVLERSIPAWFQSGLLVVSLIPLIQFGAQLLAAGDARSSAAAFAFNALFAGVIVPEAPYPPASVLNYTTFTELVGVPSQVFRAAMAVLIAFWVVRMLRVFEIERGRKLEEVRQAALEAAQQRSRGLTEEVARSEARYRHLFETARDAIFLHDLDGQFLDVNRAACRHLGYTRDELLNMRVSDIDTPEITAKSPDIMAEFMEAGEILTESAHVRKDGTVVPVELSSRLIEDDGRQLILTFARDITERKKAEERLSMIKRAGAAHQL